MKKNILSFDEQLIKEKEVVLEFIGFFSDKKDLSRCIYDEWTAKDVLGHITSWHMSFSRNLLSAVQSLKANPFKGSLTDVNEREVKFMSGFSVDELILK